MTMIKLLDRIITMIMKVRHVPKCSHSAVASATRYYYVAYKRVDCGAIGLTFLIALPGALVDAVAVIVAPLSWSGGSGAVNSG